SMQISISSLQTHNVNRCGRSRHLARKLSLRRKRSSPNVFEMAATETITSIILIKLIRVSLGTVRHPRRFKIVVIDIQITLKQMLRDFIGIRVNRAKKSGMDNITSSVNSRERSGINTTGYIDHAAFQIGRAVSRNAETDIVCRLLLAKKTFTTVRTTSTKRSIGNKTAIASACNPQHGNTIFLVTIPLFSDPAPPKIYTLSLHDALPIYFIGIRVNRAKKSGMVNITSSVNSRERSGINTTGYIDHAAF